jgi:two-component system, chemotaxis family, chemotaxis protein CheY
MAKILIAEDSVFMRQMIKDILSKAGYQDVIEAENGQQAIDLVKKEKPDLLLLDIIMPEIDGIGVLEKIDTRKTPVIVISAVGQEQMLEQANNMGVAGYIVKPFEEIEVVKTVKEVLVHE